MQDVNWVALTIFVLLFAFITWLGFAAAHWRKGDLNLLHEWGLGGRRFGTVVTWFLVGGDVYTAYTFIAVPALAFGAGGDGDEGVSGVDIATDEEPGDNGAEAPAAQSPLMQQVEIALAPVRGGEAQPGDKGKQQYEDRERNPVHVLHDIPPGLSGSVSGYFSVAR